jgi:hypothetical protein
MNPKIIKGTSWDKLYFEIRDENKVSLDEYLDIVQDKIYRCNDGRSYLSKIDQRRSIEYI